MGLFFFVFTLIFLFNFSPSVAHRVSISPLGDNNVNNDLKTYIIHVKQPTHSTLLASDQSISSSQRVDEYYRSFFPVSIMAKSSTDNNQPQERMVYSYHNVMSGFAARLTEKEVKAMEAKNGFVSARPDRIIQLRTTHTPNFLGLHQQMGFWKDSNFGKGVIIGVLDSGVLPSHASFSGEGMPPPPAKWKGQCEFNASYCNNKIIGARSFHSGAKAAGQPVPSPVDEHGHGTHTASTAAGAFVKNANVIGNANGTAVGMAPLAHLAIYRVCFLDTDCMASDILAGFDSAVEDGVDVLSVSLGDEPHPFYNDTFSIGSFGAIQKGIFVSCAAGNAGPSSSTLSNDAPWILTVGASTTDRTIRAIAKLGNGEEFNGESLFQLKDFNSTRLLPLVYAGALSGKVTGSEFCREGSLNGTDVKGKVVVCERDGNVSSTDKSEEVMKAGGAAMILVNDPIEAYTTSAEFHSLPATQVSFADGLKIKAYINASSSTNPPMATIFFKGTTIGMPTAPMVTSYSSRGPSKITPGILKPDILGPGEGIVAAWPFSPQDSTTSFNMLSGTSMACPHLSGIAALLKSSHPEWSPAAIKSAIMTTADLVNLQGEPIVDQNLHPADLYATGSGHVNPSRANKPGLVYDIQPDDYIPYLCGLGYTDDQVGIIAHKTISCMDKSSISEGQLNYPSFTVKFGRANASSPTPEPVTFTRTVTNVGEAHSNYTVEIVPPQGVGMTVEPAKLYFSEVNQKLTYAVTFTPTSPAGGNSRTSFAQGFLKWVFPNKYFVRSPILVKFEV